MSTQIQYRRGTSAEHELFTGAAGEITVDTTENSVRVHDGSTLSGTLLAKKATVNAINSYATSGFTHANSAYNKANSAYDHANTKFASAGGTISGDVNVTGNLTVTGYQVYSNTTVSLIADNIITLNAAINQASAPTSNAGIEIDRGSSTNTSILWNETTDKWTFTNDGTTYNDIAAAGRLDSAYGHANSAYGHANSAYDKANSGYTQANTGTTHAGAAFTHANSAYGHANAGYTQANTGTTHASAAFLQANTALTEANSAYEHANSAYDKANSGYTQANTGTTHASSAYDKANSGYTQANTGTTHAGAAYAHANAGYTQANTGTTHAGAAYAHANAGYTQANTGTTHASAAYAHANTRFASAGGTVSGDMAVTGNLTVNGTTTTINSTTLTVDDINIELGSIASPTDVTAAGGGITLKGATDKTISWSAANGWSSSEDFNVVTGKTFKINGTSVLSSTTLGSGVTGSSLTSVGTIGTGVWQGSSISTTYTDAKITTVGGQTGAISNTQLLNFLIAVDGVGSGLDADLLDGQSNTFYQNANNINAGTLAAARLATSGVTAGTYASASIIPVVTVDVYGRVTAVTNTSIAIASGAVSGLAASATTDTTVANNISSGILPVARLGGSYTGITGVGTLTAGSIPTSLITGLATSATTDTTNASNIGSGTLAAARLATSGVTAGVYGSASIHPVITVDTYGRVTAVTNTSVAIASGAVSGLAASATTDTTNATNISSGTLAAARLATSGVVAGTFASGAIIPVITVDTYGRVTAVTNTSVAIAAAAVSGLAASATTDTTSATNISSGTLATARLSGSYTGITGVGTLAAGSIPTSLITGLATSATTDTTNATNITSGTLAVARLPTTSIANTGTFTSSTITVDAYGRVTAAANGASGGGGVSGVKLYFYGSF